MQKIDNSINQLKRIKLSLQKILKPELIQVNRQKFREYYQLLENYIRVFEDVVDWANKNDKEVLSLIGKALYDFSYKVFKVLGRQPEPSINSLKHYDHNKYGPFLGVSDEGSAADIIRQAAFTTPKYKSLKNPEPIQVGISCDAERLAAVGEVAVGPDEYIDIRLKCLGSILNSTNVGTRLNVRYSKTRPIVYIRSKRGKDKNSLKVQKAEWEAEKAFTKIKEILNPFIFTPDKNPRPLTILVYFWYKDSVSYKKSVFSIIIEKMKKDKLIRTQIHKIALLENVIYGENKIQLIKQSIELLSELKIEEISLSGQMRYNATTYLSLPGVLNYLSDDEARTILAYSAKRNIKLTTRELVDTETVSRNIWTGLNSAKLMGLELGKYGLFPLTLAEVEKVTNKVQGWFEDWTAAPVLYIDYPIVTNKTIYGMGRNLVEGIKLWIKTVSKNNISVILIDTADKSKGFKLVKKSDQDKKGILTFKQIKDINEFANKLNIKTLWAGGISLEQIFDFGKMQVFGIYVTSSAATQIPVSERYKEENMPVEKEPTFEGVFNSKILLEAGFLYSLLINKREIKKASELKTLVKLFLKYISQKSEGFGLDTLRTVRTVNNNFTKCILEEWKKYLP